MFWVGCGRLVRCVVHVCSLTDEAELSFPTTIACTPYILLKLLSCTNLVFYMWCTREAVLQLSSANWARFGGTRQRETTSAHPGDECFLQRRFINPQQRYLFIGGGVPPSRLYSKSQAIKAVSWKTLWSKLLGSGWPCTSWQKIHEILCLLSAFSVAKGRPPEKKMRASPLFACHPEYFCKCSKVNHHFQNECRMGIGMV